MNGKDARPIPRGAPASYFVLPVLLIAFSSVFSSYLLHERSLSEGKGGKDERRVILQHEISMRPSLSLGFRNFLSDLAWLEAVQVAGSRRMTPKEYDTLYLLTKVVSNYDPRFVVPYLVGGLVLGDSSSHVPQALETLERGWKHHPSDWRFPFYMGYLHYFSLGDPAEGGRYLEAASRLPGSPSYLPLLASRMLVEGRSPETALALLSEMIKQETDPARWEAIRKRIREVAVERDLQLLEGAIAQYLRKTGGAPGSLADLVGAGVLRAVPSEPNGGTYLLLPDGTVRSSRMAERLRVFRPR